MEAVIRNAVIESTHLGWEDHGILTCYLYLDYGGSSQGFGGYALDEPTTDRSGKFAGRAGSATGMRFIERILKTVGAEKWEDLKGKHVRVRQDNCTVHSIGHFLEEKWFSPEEFCALSTRL